MRFAVPRRHLPEFTFGGATYDTGAAFERGWVDEVVESDALIPRANAAAQELARLSPAAFAQTKKQLRQEAAERVERSRALTDQTVTDIWTGAIDDIRDYVARLSLIHISRSSTFSHEKIHAKSPCTNQRADAVSRA